MASGIVFDIMRFCTHDGPGIRTTVFLKGCPLTCAWCHNPESQSPKPELIVRPNLCIHCGACITACPQGAIYSPGDKVLTDMNGCTLCPACSQACYADAREIVGREMTAAEVTAEVVKDVPIYAESGGGVTVSGGEPLLQWQFLSELLTACQDHGIHTALDTSGYAPWNNMNVIRDHVNLFLFDLKVMDDVIHRRVTGVSNRLILDNLHRLAELGHDIVLRLPLVPGVNDSPEELRDAARLAASLPGVTRLDVLPYHKHGLEKYSRLQRDYLLSQAEPPGAAQVALAAAILGESGLSIQVGG